MAAEDDFERIDGPAGPRTERARDRAPRAAPDQHAQVATPQVEGTPDPRRKAAGQLRIAGLETDRRPNPTRPDGLQRHADASDERHAPAVQRVGLDRVDFPRR